MLSHKHESVRSATELQRRTPDYADDWALFLDVDGTLLEFHDDPAAVAVDASSARPE